MSARTSLTHPLAIAEIATRTDDRVDLTLCPGKRQPIAATRAWEWDLNADLDAIQAWGATAVVTLIKAHEIDDLSVGGLGDDAASRRARLSWSTARAARAGRAGRRSAPRRGGSWVRGGHRRRRPGAIEIPAQERYVHALGSASAD